MNKVHNCPNCSKQIDTESLLVHCSVSWPNQDWAYFTCPNCNESSHIKLTPGLITFGFIDGAPGPCFVPTARNGVKGMEVEKAASGITVKLNGRSWFIPAKR